MENWLNTFKSTLVSSLYSWLSKECNPSLDQFLV